MAAVPVCLYRDRPVYHQRLTARTTQRHNTTADLWVLCVDTCVLLGESSLSSRCKKCVYYTSFYRSIVNIVFVCMCVCVCV